MAKIPAPKELAEWIDGFIASPETLPDAPSDATQLKHAAFWLRHLQFRMDEEDRHKITAPELFAAHVQLSKSNERLHDERRSYWQRDHEMSSIVRALADAVPEDCEAFTSEKLSHIRVLAKGARGFLAKEVVRNPEWELSFFPLKVFYNTEYEDWFIARSVEHAQSLWEQLTSEKGSDEEKMAWQELPGDMVLSVASDEDGSTESKPVSEWLVGAEAGLLASRNF